jgi:hypothetical protein
VYKASAKKKGLEEPGRKRKMGIEGKKKGRDRNPILVKCPSCAR